MKILTCRLIIAVMSQVCAIQ